ncbi:MAG: glycoside hydrolase family 15 protein [Chryseolinea sp.]
MVCEITDYMPVEEIQIGKELVPTVSCIRGTLTFEMECRPRFDYARATHKVTAQDDKQISFISDGIDMTTLRLRSTVPMVVSEADAIKTFTLQTGDRATLILECVTDPSELIIAMDHFIEKSLFDTINYWKDRVSKSNHKGRWLEMVHRSTLVLKLMTSLKYGSVVASPTFGLPEEIGGVRNWDYRYTWIRDASFTIYALLKLGYRKEARKFISWVELQCRDIGEAGSLSLMYGIDGRKDLFETELTHLSGYKNSQPVRIGNAAYNQIQLDIYGELLDAVYLYDKYAEPIV